jgi:hypothetical protein
LDLNKNSNNRKRTEQATNNTDNDKKKTKKQKTAHIASVATAQNEMTQYSAQTAAKNTTTAAGHSETDGQVVVQEALTSVSSRSNSKKEQQTSGIRSLLSTTVPVQGYLRTYRSELFSAPTHGILQTRRFCTSDAQ